MFCARSELYLLHSRVKCNNIHINRYVSIITVFVFINDLLIQHTIERKLGFLLAFLRAVFLQVMAAVISCIACWLRHLTMRRTGGEWATSVEEVCRGERECSNATQLVASFFNKSSTSASRLFAAARRRTPGNERLHLIRRKWKRNHAQKTPTGGSRRVRYSASVDWLFGRRAIAIATALQRRSLVLSCHCTWLAYTQSLTYCLFFCLSVSRAVCLCAFLRCVLSLNIRRH